MMGGGNWRTWGSFPYRIEAIIERCQEGSNKGLALGPQRVDKGHKLTILGPAFAKGIGLFT
jgi:hypothetical protein